MQPELILKSDDSQFPPLNLFGPFLPASYQKFLTPSSSTHVNALPVSALNLAQNSPLSEVFLHYCCPLLEKPHSDSFPIPLVLMTCKATIFDSYHLYVLGTILSILYMLYVIFHSHNKIYVIFHSHNRSHSSPALPLFLTPNESAGSGDSASST